MTWEAFLANVLKPVISFVLKTIGRLLKKHPFGTISGLFVVFIGVVFVFYVIELRKLQSSMLRLELHLQEEPLTREEVHDDELKDR